MRRSLPHLILLGSILLLLAAIPVASAIAECTSPLLLDAPIPFLTGPNAHFIATGDFNEDGITDLAVTNGDLSPGSPAASLAVLLGLGNRSYAPPALHGVGNGARGVVARDFNGDGILDIAVSNKFSDVISVLLGQGAGGIGDGTFAPAVGYPAGPGPFELVAEDFNGDGILDLATCLNHTGGVRVLPGLGAGGIGNGTFGAAVHFPLSALSTGLAAGDFNGDGNPDLVATQNFGSSVAVLLGTGQSTLGPGSFSGPGYHAAGPEPFHVHVADFDEDGRQDLAVANTSGGGIHVLRGLGTGAFSFQGSLASGNSSAVSAGDLNQDGILDIVTGTITGSNSGAARVFLGQGAGGVGDGTFGAGTPYPSGGDVYQVITGDLDQDGATDALTAQGYGDHVVMLAGVCAEPPADPRAPVLTDVRDVPNDDGGWVFLTWTASSLDVTGGAVNSYRVWRRIPPALVSAATRARLSSREVMATPGDGSASEVVYWEALATLPAQRLPGYGYTAATTQDSMRLGNPHTAFFVTALTSDIDVFYSSNVDSGYSVDNVRPGAPAGFAGAPTGSGFSLSWEPGGEADLAGYRLYRGATEDFAPSEASRIAAPEEPGWVDPQGSGQWFYKLTAVDIHENESGVSLLAPVVSAGGQGAATALALLGARPNPSLDGRLSIHFALPGDVPARIELLDLTGRRILSRSLSAWGAGSHALTLGDEKPLPSGIYFVRLVQGRQSIESKVVVAR